PCCASLLRVSCMGRLAGLGVMLWPPAAQSSGGNWLLGMTSPAWRNRISSTRYSGSARAAGHSRLSSRSRAGRRNMMHVSSGANGQPIKQGFQGVEALFAAFHGYLELEQGGAFEFVAVGLALDQLDQHQRVDAGVGGKLETPALGAGVDLLDAELLRLQLEQGQAHQVLGRLRQ